MKFFENFSTVVTLLKKKEFLLKDCIWQTPKENLRKTADSKFQYVSVLFIKKHLKFLKRNKAA